MTKGLSKIYLFAMLVACILFVINGCNEYLVGPNDNVNNTSFVAKESFSFGATASNNSKLRLEGINGNITITGNSTSDSITIRGEKNVASESMDDAQAHLTQLNVSMQNITNGFLIKTTQPSESNGRSYIVNYIISLSSNYEISVELLNGNVSVDSINNTVTVSNVNGEITLNNISGSTFVSLVNGQIKCKQSLPKDGKIKLGSVNGNIILDIPKSTSAEFSAGTVNGNITASNLAFQNQVLTSNSLQGKLNTGEGKIDLSIVNGNISVAGY